MSSTSRTPLAWAAWAAVCVLWGTTYLAIRIALETIPPLMMGLRWTAAGALLLAMLALGGQRLPARGEWPALTLLGVLFIGVGNGGVVWAEQTLPSGLTALLVAVIPFWMVMIEKLTGNTPRLGLRRALGLLVGFIGIVVLVWPDLDFGGGLQALVGIGATQLACVGWAVGSIYARRRRADENVLGAAAFQMLFGGIAMTLAGIVHGEWPLLAITARTGSAFVYLMLFGSIAGFSAYAYALKHLPVTTVSLYAYVNPVIAVALGTLVLGEPLNPRLAAAGAVVLVGMAMVRR